MKTRRDEVHAFITKDGSEVRELMHPASHGNQHQSLAEAKVPVGGSTLRHRHRQSEELYHFLAGTGEMSLGDSQFQVGPGDTVLIPPGTPHGLRNTGTEPLRLLCCCSPAYAHEDTELLQAQENGADSMQAQRPRA